jgi:hypothetical protein
MIDSDSAQRPAASSIGWPGVVGILVAILGLPAFLDQGVPLRLPFNERPLRALEKAKPRGVLLGDSMLETRIDPKVLTALAGERWEVLAQSGSSSAIWFLAMKNLIAVQSPPPRTVIIFFRDRQLTLPAHRTDGGYRKTIEGFMSASEPEVERILQTSARRQQNWLERLSLAMYPVQWRREAWRDRIQNKALDLVASSREYGKIRSDARAIFGVRNLRQDSGLDFEHEEGGQKGLDPEDHEFTAMVDHSFLPAILEIAREKNIQLVFFRVKRKPSAGNAPAHRGSTFPAYAQELRAYLEKAGAKLVDETQDADVTVSFYGADDHVADGMMKPYTELFWRKMSARLEPASGNNTGPVR